MKRLLSLFLLFALLPQFLAASDDAEVVSTPKPRDVSADHYWQALILFRSTKNDEVAKGRALLTEAADMEFTPAQFYLGLCYQDGRHGFPKQPKKAVNWFRLCAERGNVFGMCYLGLSYFTGSGVRKDAEQAEKWEKAVLSADPSVSMPVPPPEYAAQVASAGSRAQEETLSGQAPVSPYDQVCATAHLVLGDLATQAGKVPEAQEHYLKAAKMGPGGRAGLAQAATKAAINCAFGQGVPRDMKKATELLDQAKAMSQRSIAVQAHSLVEMKLHDDFAQSDLEEDMSKAAELQQSLIQIEIAGSFADPKSKNYDPKEAARWFELAAASNQSWAMLSLAFLHAEGKLGKPEPEKAFQWFLQATEKGKDIIAAGNLAICYQNGIGTARDPEKAAALFKQYSRFSMICYLGSIGQCPSNFITGEKETEMIKTAAKRKDKHAMYLLGMRTFNGWGVKQDVDEAVSLLKKAAALSHGPSLTELGVLCETQPRLMGYRNFLDGDVGMFGYFTKAAAAKDPNGYVGLGTCYLGGKGCPTNLNLSMENLERCIALDPKHDVAWNNLGNAYRSRCVEAYREGDHALVEELKNKMLECYQKSDDLGSAFGAFNLGVLAYDGINGKYEYQEAYLKFESAASRGLALARRRLGQMHEQGIGVPVTLRDAAYHYRLGALMGDLECLERLCNFYLHGKGVSQDFDRAAFWIEKLIMSGKRNALVNYCDVLMRKGDYANAYKLLKELVESPSLIEQGYANHRLSIMYEKGLGVKQNPAKAKACHEKAFNLSDPDALHKRAVRLITAGKASEAIPLLERAMSTSATTGHTASFYALGCLLMTGNGVPKDVPKAWRHIYTAARNGNSDALISLAQSTLTKIQGAPKLDEAIDFAKQAEAMNHPKAASVRAKLEALRDQTAPAPSAEGANPRSI